MKMKILIAIMSMAILSSCNNDVLSEENTNNSQNSLTAKSRMGIYDGPASPLINRITTISRFSSGASSGHTKSCETKKIDYDKNYNEFTRFTTRNHLLWPGNLIQKNTFLSENMAVFPTGGERNEITVKIDGPLFGDNGGGETIEATASNAQRALGNLLLKYEKANTSFAANYEVSIQRAYSNKQLETALNIGYTGILGNISGKFGFTFDKNKTYYAVTLKQVFFTFSVDADKTSLSGAKGWIKNYTDGDMEPPVVIETVTYGRLYTLIYESSASASELSAALEALYRAPTGFLSGDFNSKYKNVMENTRVYAKQIGGNATDGMCASLSAMAKNFSQVQDFMHKGAEVSRANMGAIIHYTALNTAKSIFNLPVTKHVRGIDTYQECSDNQYKLIVKNNYTASIPLTIKTKDGRSEKWDLIKGEFITFYFDVNRKQFIYNGSPLKQIDLNNGCSSDDIDFIDRDFDTRNPQIKYQSQRIGYRTVIALFDKYQEISKTIAETAYDKDGINQNGDGPSAQLISIIDLENNALVIDIK
ncbi:thiol-activated cytolysin family protein [Chryseobacterium potabilaquae]|uniref:Listeriolysin O n=1 Tax=Chryseobacterium potabilaquae TaxID=2675057 RepID=A0A6N4XF02_9FLAO|nr:thiol-activated cytolysin family protein [Chryseobacterium potabilaquae]CAA7197530.1 Listeriolysin O [Chryseobacterium potabilaquae]